MWDLLRDFARFLRQEKKWWLVPLIGVLLLLGLLVVASSSAGVSSFLYPFL